MITRNLWPYGDMHELNLDWLLDELKKAVDNWKQTTADIKDVKTDMESLKKYVNEYFQNLNIEEELDEKIRQKLDEMVADGTLETLVQSVMRETQIINPVPMYQISHKKTTYHTGTSGYTFLQGATTDGIYMYMLYGSTEDVKGFRLEKRAFGGGTLVENKTYTMIDKPSGLDLYDGKIYVACNANGLVLIDIDNLDNVEVHPEIGHVRAVSIDTNGEVWGFDNSSLYFKVTSDWTRGETKSLPYQLDVWQACTVRDGFVYDTGTNPTCVYKTHIKTNKLVKVFGIERWIDFYCFGEHEQVFADRTGKNFFTASCAYLNYSDYHLAQIFKLNFETNQIPKTMYGGGSTNAMNILYVNENAEFNCLPDGSINNPFTNMGAVLTAFNSPCARDLGISTIELQSDMSDICYHKNYNIIINGGKNKYSLDRSYFRNCNVALTNVFIKDKVKPNDNNDPFRYTLYAQYCDLSLDGVTIDMQNKDTKPAYFNMCRVNDKLTKVVNSSVAGTADGKIGTYYCMVQGHNATLLANYDFSGYTLHN